MSFVKILPVLAVLAFAAPAMAHTKAATTSNSTTAKTTPSGLTTPGTPAPASTSAPAPTPMAPAATKTTGASSSKLPANEQFSTTTAAQASCPGDTVVWSTMSSSKNYHASTSKYFGKTKHGAYACQKVLDSAGFHAAKT